jgi:hypothetical protein
MSEPTKVIDRQIDAYNRRDVEGFVGCYAIDAHIYGPDGLLLAAGHDGLRAHYGPAFVGQPNVRARVTNRIAVGTVVVDHELVTGFVTDGLPSEVNAVLVYRVADGLIQDARLYR